LAGLNEAQAEYRVEQAFTSQDCYLPLQQPPARIRDTFLSFESSCPPLELDLLQITAALSANLSAGPAEIVGSEPLNPNLFR